MQQLSISPDLKNLEGAMDFIKAGLEKTKTSRKDLNRTLLICEEVIVAAIENANSDSEISFSIKKKFGKLILNITSLGEQFKPDSTLSNIGVEASDLENSQVEYALRNLLLRHYAKRINYSHKGGVNNIKIVLYEDERFGMKLTLGAIALSVALGLFYRFVIPEIGMVIYTNINKPITTIFINSMKCLVGPIVFFSILNSIIGFDDIKLLGRIGAKLMGLYVLTSVIACTVGLSLSVILHPGEVGSYIPEVVTPVAADSANTGSISDMIVGFFPSNFFAAFLNNDTIQLIIIAVACGLALGSMGKRNERIRELVGSINEMIGIICSAVAKTIPFVILCSFSGLILTADARLMVSMLSMCGVTFVGLGIMLLVYCTIIIIFTRMNPFVLIKKYLRTAITVFTVSSSNACIPINMEFSDKIGVSKKLYTISVPLGATLNMDGGCIGFIVLATFLARIYGNAITPEKYLPLLILTIFISMGVPGVAGGTTAFIIPLLHLLGAPSEMALVILGVDAILDMTRTMINTLGDQCITLVVASSEGLIDKGKYYSKA